MTTPPLFETDLGRWFLNRGVAVILGAFAVGGAWVSTKNEIAAVRAEVQRIDVDGSRAVRGVRPTLDSLRGDVAEIKRYLCGDRPLCSRAGGVR